MLLEFELENAGAFALPTAISLVASKLKDDQAGKVVAVGDQGKTDALTSALILGKNGSGKTTLIKSLAFIARFVRDSAKDKQLDEGITYDPNQLSGDLFDRPTRFRLAFSMHGTIYDFEFSFTKKRITYEKLYVADKSVRYRKMYERKYLESENSYVYSYGEALSGNKIIWENSTKENSLFISTANLLNSEDLKFPFQWLTGYIKSYSITANSGTNYTQKKCLESKDYSKRISSFLRSLDINVEEIEIEEEEVDSKFLQSTFTSEFIETLDKTTNNGHRSILKAFFLKKRSDGTLYRMPLSKESTGTAALFGLSGPIFDTLENGYCLLIDEINTSLHPLIVGFLVDLFANPEINTKRAQLVFTSHDTSVLSRRKLRRDQIWFIENSDGNAQIYPLSDFSPRKKEALDRGYLVGRYGGVPLVAPAMFPHDILETHDG